MRTKITARSEVIEILEQSTPAGDFLIAEVVEKARANLTDELFG